MVGRSERKSLPDRRVWQRDDIENVLKEIVLDDVDVLSVYYGQGAVADSCKDSIRFSGCIRAGGIVIR